MFNSSRMHAPRKGDGDPPDLLLGPALRQDGACDFLIYAPSLEWLEIHLLAPDGRRIRCRRSAGYHWARVPDVQDGTRYWIRFPDGSESADPASRSQPEGVHGPSAVVNPAFPWSDQSWPGLPLERYILYELHTGVFSPEGTFEAVIPHLEELRRLGITAIELMPVAQFPGARNWGYDGVFPFAAQNTYGGPAALRRLVDACHRLGMAVVLDVVFNHLGPEGNCLPRFGPYFTSRYHTPWGAAINFDGPHSHAVRRYFIECALYWVTDCHVDGLRLDAIHAICDASPHPFLAQLSAAVRSRARQLGRHVVLFAECPANDNKVVREPGSGGFGLDAQWNDDFHHSLRALLTGENDGYYADYGELSHLEKCWRQGWVYTGQYSRYRRRFHGSPAAALEGRRFVVFSQNHDHTGNRRLGERLGQLAPFEALKVAAACVLLSPFVPLLFMGEEYDEPAPFLYFVSHSDQRLVEAVRKGRKEEFSSFAWDGEPPDPQASQSFLRSKLNRLLRRQGRHAQLYRWYQELLRLRRDHPALARLDRERCQAAAHSTQRVLTVCRWDESEAIWVLFSFARQDVALAPSLPPGVWRRLLDSREPRFGGAGDLAPETIPAAAPPALRLGPYSVVVYARASAQAGQHSTVARRLATPAV